MEPFPVKAEKISGFDDANIVKNAKDFFATIERKTKRRPYIRSAYFDKQKIFFTYFWHHLFQKPPKERRMRIQFLACAIELVQKSKNAPSTKENPNKPSELLHRFVGITKEKEVFYVQIKENKKTDRKELMSVFPQVR